MSIDWLECEKLVEDAFQSKLNIGDNDWKGKMLSRGKGKDLRGKDRGRGKLQCYWFIYESYALL